MEEKIYRDMAEQQKKHWWFRARREILNSILNRFVSSDRNKILEVGCGTGGNLLMLKNYGDVFAMELDNSASEYAKNETGIDVRNGWLPDNIPYKTGFDIICMFDVLEHIQKDRNALEKITNILNHKGILIITVPAYSWLYGTHDKILHHYRRYTLKKLLNITSCLELTVLKYSYFNTLLFPLVILTRLFDKLNRSKSSVGYEIPYSIINQLLYKIFSMEKKILSKAYLPFGSSIILVMQKKAPH